MKTVLVILSLVLTLILGACTSSLPNPNGPNQPPIEAAITSFGANPNPVPQNIATQFSWSVVGVDLTCRLDVDNNGTVDYTVQGCTSASRVAHQYPEVGKYTARLTITAASGETRSETTGVEVGIANQAPIPNLKLAVPSNNTDPLAVRFSWVVSDQDADITRCQLDAEGDGSWEYDGLCAGLSAQSVGPSDLVSYYFEYTFTQQGQYTAVLQASDAYQSNSATVVVRVPLNKPPVIEHLGATVENGRLKVNYRVSDPDGDAVACVLKIDGVGRFAYDDCRTPFQTYPTMGQEKFEITLEASDPYQTTSRFLKYLPQGCGPVQNTDWSTTALVDPNRQLETGNATVAPVTAVAVSPDCRYLAAAMLDSALVLWDYRDLSKPPVQIVEDTRDGIGCKLEFSPDGRYLAEVGCSLMTAYLRLWDLSGTRPRQVVLPVVEDVTDAAFSADGSKLALTVRIECGFNGVMVVDTSNFAQVKREIPIEGMANSVAYSPNGKILVVGYQKVPLPAVVDGCRVVGSATKSASLFNLVRPLQAPGNAYIAFFNGENPTTPFLDFPMPNELFFTNDLDFTPDGRQMVGVVWGVAGTNIIFRWEMGSTAPLSPPVYSNEMMGMLAFDIAVSPDSRWVAAPTLIYGIPTFVAELDTLVVRGGYHGYNGVAFSPDGRYLLAGSLDGLSAVTLFQR